jgi:hypothetical protein
VAVIATWAALVVLGGALVYWPQIPEGVSYGTGLEPAQRGDFTDALYVSLVTTTTLGFGDIVPTAAWLRVVTPLQALIGFTLLTAAVSWVLQIYPALNRRRTMALRLTSLQRSSLHDAVRKSDSVLLAVLLEDLAGQVTQASVDFTQYAETYTSGTATARSPSPWPCLTLPSWARSACGRDVRTSVWRQHT